MAAADPDHELRQAAMARVRELQRRFDDLLPLPALQEGFSYKGERISFGSFYTPGPSRGSNFLVVSPERSATGNSLGVMGPQLGYYYPEIVQQMDLHGPGINAQGIAVPGLAFYILIGRTKNYAWSLTSAGHDVRDVYAERLCEPGGGTPTRESEGYVYRGKCRRRVSENAGLLAGKPLLYKSSVHGPLFGTATVGGSRTPSRASARPSAATASTSPRSRT